MDKRIPYEHGTFEFSADASGERLDVFLSRVSNKSRAQVQRLISDGDALVNGQSKKANFKLREQDRVEMRVQKPVALQALPEDIPIDIVYQDQDIIIVNKAQGMVVHPAAGNERGTLVNALLFHIRDLSGIGGVIRPGIVHRIDKMTSGLLVIAKNDAAHASLSEQIKSRAAKRKYLALVEGNLKEDAGVVDAPIGRHPNDRKRMAVVSEGREARTHWRALERMGQYTLIEASLDTGRTHQIRVHMKYIQHAVAGDIAYNHAKERLGLIGQALHAYRLSLNSPSTGARMDFYAPPPEYFIAALKRAGWSGIPVWELEA